MAIRCTYTSNPLSVLLVFLVACSPEIPPPEEGPGDPVVTDPETSDPAYPPTMVELKLNSQGSQLNGLMYLSSGPGPHPTAVLLHGFPGNERNLDLAQALRRAGVNVLYFNYRGTWGSGGIFSVENAIEDVSSALAFLRSEAGTEQYRVDPEKIFLVGHSFGGFLAAMGTAGDQEVSCLVFLAGVNLGTVGRDTSAESTAAATAMLEPDFHPESGPVRGDPAAMVREIQSHAEEFDLANRVGSLADRPILMVAAERDLVVPKHQMHDPLVEALKATGSPQLSELIFDSDHYFSGHRIALSRAVVGWVLEQCWE